MRRAIAVCSHSLTHSHSLSLTLIHSYPHPHPIAIHAPIWQIIAHCILTRHHAHSRAAAGGADNLHGSDSVCVAQPREEPLRRASEPGRCI
eukprot:IDg5157t1